MNWWHVYDNKLVPELQSRTPGDKAAAKRGLHSGFGQRIEGFRLMFELLLAQSRPQYHVIETGTCRNPGNWKDGQSAVIFTAFVDLLGGSVRSVDIDAAACLRASQHISSDRFSVYCSDSVAWLKQQTDLDQVDLFYLDSWDVTWHDDQASADHHLREFLAIESYLKPGAVVAIDDNSRLLVDGRRTGKGRRIVEYLADKNQQPLYDGYQIVYQF
jgi:hypothetical protein